MRVPLFLVASIVVLAVEGRASTKSGLKGQIGNYSAYFTDQVRLRHSRFSLELTQTTVLLPYRLSTVVDIRGRSDIALYGKSPAPNWDFDQSVVNDEANEFQVREAYADYLSDHWRLKIGEQKIDWIESLSPSASGILTPLDLRHGGFGEAGDVIEPVGAALFNVGILGGSIDTLFVLLPAVHRFPIHENGYGFRKMINGLFPDAVVQLDDDKLPLKASSSEYGMRYMATFSGYDFSLFGFYGHERFPALRARSIGPADVVVEQVHPFVKTYGIGLTKADDAYVIRSQILLQPEHSLPLTVAFPLDGVVAPVGSQDHLRITFGFDYAYSKHIKFYSESMWTKITTSPSDYYDSESGIDNQQDEYLITTKLTNESFDDVLLALTSTITAPKESAIISPTVEWNFLRSYTMAGGYRHVISNDEHSPYTSLKDSNHVFVSVEQKFSEKAFN